jgi:hypothetical protein
VANVGSDDCYDAVIETILHFWKRSNMQAFHQCNILIEEQKGNDIDPLYELAQTHHITSHALPDSVYLRTVQHIRINKDTTNICSHITTDLITHCCTKMDSFNKVTLASTDNEHPEDCVTTPKHVGAILM